VRCPTLLRCKKSEWFISHSWAQTHKLKLLGCVVFQPTIYNGLTKKKKIDFPRYFSNNWYVSERVEKDSQARGS